MRRLDVFLGLALFFVLAAAGLAVTPTYNESATSCGSVVDRDLFPVDAFCDGRIDGRMHQVITCAVLGGLLLLAAVLVRRHQGEPDDSDERPRGARVVGLLVPLPAGVALFTVALLEERMDGADVAASTLLAAGAAGVLGAVAVAASRGLHREHALAAGAISLPLTWAVLCLPAAWERRFSSTTEPVVLRLGDAGLSVWFPLAGAPVALALAAAVAWQQADRPAPTAGRSWLAVFVSASFCAGLFALGLIPGTSSAGGLTSVNLIAVTAAMGLLPWVGTRRAPASSADTAPGRADER